jgi:hypothetical protein
VGTVNKIMAHFDYFCVDGNCDTYDRVGGVRVRNYRGEWIELFRYITPFGVECEDDVDVSDLPAGLYFVNIVGGKVVTKKVIVE